MLRPLTAWLPTGVRRNLALGGLGVLAAAPGGSRLIEFLGHMSPEPCLRTSLLDRQLMSPVGLAADLDPEGAALRAFARFGVGFVEVDVDALASIDARRIQGLSLWARVTVRDDRHSLLELETALGAARGVDALSVTVVDGSAAQVPGDARLWRSLVTLARQHGITAVLADVPIDDSRTMGETAVRCGAAGIVLRGQSDSPDAPGLISTARQEFPRPVVIVAACGAESPREIVASIQAGADLVALGRGITEAGPGLPKRANEALAALRCPQAPPPRAIAFNSGWVWALFLGLGMLIAGSVVWWVGATRVVLPYDLVFLGLNRDALAGINPRLLGFMEHDRITLAGTLISIGLLYASLAWNGMRRGWRWSKRALAASGAVGFANLFLFLGFHYVDPLHIALSAGLFPLFALAFLLQTPRIVHPSRDLDNDSAWRLGLTGQLFFIGLGVGLVVAGITISAVGITSVFVFSDLQFLQTTAVSLSNANAHLLPLIAHDRAGFGGALASDGVAVTLIALWGFRRGERWIWWTLLLAGLAGLLSGIYAHIAVGYLEFGHLFPVFVSGVVFILGLGFSGPFLLTRSPAEVSSS